MLKKMIVLAICVVIFGAMVLISGCSNPYIAPNTNKALTEQSQLEEQKAQTQAMQEQNEELKRIADALEKIAKK